MVFEIRKVSQVKFPHCLFIVLKESFDESELKFSGMACSIPSLHWRNKWYSVDSRVLENTHHELHSLSKHNQIQSGATQ